MSGIKSFEHFQEASTFDCAFDLFVSCFAVFRWAELKPACILLLVNTFSHAQIYSLCRTVLSISSVKEPFVRRKTLSEIEGQ